MESLARVKKSLRTPVRRLSSCVTRVKERRLYGKRRRQRCRGGGGRLGRTPPLRTAHAKDPSVTRSYQADLERERKLREATNAQKNAERAALRAHFRRKYQLAENQKDGDHLRSAGGRVSLPRELARIIHPEPRAKDDGFNLLSAFQGLSFGTALLTGGKHSKTPTPAPRGASCKVM